MKLADKLKIHCAAILPSYQKAIENQSYQDKGIFFSEGLAFCALADLLKINLILESGIFGGMSTEIFARYFHFPIIGIDRCDYGIEAFRATRERLSKYTHVSLIQGDSTREMGKTLKKNRGRRVGILIDGPKGLSAIQLAQSALQHDEVAFIGIHDMGVKADNHLMDSWDNTVFYTDESWFRDLYGNLDKDIPKLNEYPLGPVIGFAVHPSLIGADK